MTNHPNGVRALIDSGSGDRAESKPVVAPESLGYVRRMQKLHAIAIGVALGAMVFPALAQETTVIGRGSGKPSVSVDYSVLDELGPAPNVPQLLMRPPSGTGTQQPAVPRAQKPKLKPPRATASHATKSAKPASKQQASATARRAAKSSAQAAAKPSAPPPPPQIAAVAPTPAPAAPPVTVPPPAPTEAQPTNLPLAAPPLAPMAGTPPAPPPLPTAPSPASSAAQPAPLSAVAPPPAPPQQMVAIPPASAPGTGEKSIQLAFPESASQLDDKAKRDLDELVRGIGTNEDTRVQLLAYASAPGADNASQARRLSLSRALAVRSYLIEKGVHSTRIDVRALGNKNEGGPADRVDVVVARR